jgi:hypothetical protein
MKVGDKVIVVQGVLADFLSGKVGTITEECIPESHISMIFGTQMWKVNFEGIGSTSFPESDLELV